MELLLRTFCVIPHEARPNALFDAVFEDGVRALFQGRLHPLFFSHVLSPAHDLAEHIVGPLLARVRQGGNAAIIVGLPGVDADDVGLDDVSGVFGEKFEVAMELYAHIIPLLFRSAERCCLARVSVVTFSAKEKKIHDMLQRCDVRSEQEAQYQLIERDGSSARWGSVMKLLHERHAQLGREDLLQAESVLVVRVELEGYGKVVIVEVDCGRETLHQLTLLLRSGGVCGSKTYPSRGPLCAVLRDVTPPSALVHLVGIPDPQHAPCSTMRLLRFLSSMSQGPSMGQAERSSLSKNSPRRQRQQQGAGSERSPREYTASEIDNKSKTNNVLPTRGSQQNYSWSKELFVDPSHCVHLPPSSKHVPLPSTWDCGTAQPNGLGRKTTDARASCVRSNIIGNNSTNSVESQVSREQALVSRVEVLDRTNRELTEALSLARAEIKHIQVLHQSSQEALRQKQDALLSLTTSNQKSIKENVDYAKLVPRLLRKLKALEKERDTLQDTSKCLTKKNNEMQGLNERLQSQLQKLQKEVRLMQKKETQRLRDQALTRIETAERERVESIKKSRRPSTAKIYRVATNSPTSDASLCSRRSVNAQRKTSRSSSLCDAFNELRQRNNLLEAEVVTLKKKLAAADDNRSAGIGARKAAVVDEDGKHIKLCATCESMRHHFNSLTEELDRGLVENERLRQLLASQSIASSKASSVVRDVAWAVVASLSAGCESLRAQLLHLESEAQRRGDDEQLTLGKVFREHIDALAALEVALQDIGGRRYRGAENYESILPTSATAADVELLSGLLLFEVERDTHLRAFLPTFAQLSVATEHLKMRMFPSNS